MKVKTVIIDDHKLFNDGLSLILKESEAFEVTGQVYNSRFAAMECRDLKPDLLLVDYNMPNLNGLDLIKELKQLPFTGKIVIISMYADNKEIKLFEEVGIDGYLTKIIPGTELIDALTRIMNGEKVIIKNIEKKEPSTDDFFFLKTKLTKRELQVMKAVKKGLTSEEIARELKLSYYTIETHRKNVNQKLQLKTKKAYFDFLETIETD